MKYPVTVESPSHLIELARQHTRSKILGKNLIENHDAACQYLRYELGTEEREVFGILMMNTRHAVIGFERLFYGDNNEAVIFPREIVRCALKHNADAIILVHNHPSGDATPSHADIRLTNRLEEICTSVGIRILSHIVVTTEGYSTILV